MSYLEAVLKNIPEEELRKINEENERRKQEEHTKRLEERNKKTFKKDSKKDSKKTSKKGSKSNKSFDNKKQNKNSLRKKKEETTSVSKTEFFEALKKAQSLMMDSCKPSNDDDKTITESLDSEGWEGHTVNVDLSEDEIVVQHDGREFNFSKSRVISSRHFQTELEKYYQEKYQNTKLKFIQPKNKSNYVINVMSSN